MVTLIAGTGRVTDGQFVGMTVADVRSRFSGAYNIPADASANVNGRQVDGTYTLQAGDELVFSKPAGQKGN